MTVKPIKWGAFPVSEIETTLVGGISDTREPEKMIVRSVYKFKEPGEVRVRVDWIGSADNGQELDFVRLRVTAYGEKIDFIYDPAVMAAVGRALCQAAAECQAAQIDDLRSLQTEART